jgi:hypothetical protein
MFDKRFKIEEMLKFIVEDELKLILKKNQIYREGKDLTEIFFENKEI